MASKRELVKAVWLDVKTELGARGGTWLPKRKRIFGVTEPLPGEVFSSWVHRSAISSRLPLKQLKAIWGIRSPLYWIDCRAMPLDAEPISSLVNHLHVERINDTLWPQYTYLRKWRGLSLTSEPLERRPVYRYCPECLKRDEIPFFRKAWRLAFNYVCAEHGVLLRNSCPACNKKIDLNQDRDNKTLEHPTAALRYCQYCGADLCSVNEPSLSTPMYDLLVEAQYKMQLLLFDASRSEDICDQDQYLGPPWSGSLMEHLVGQVALAQRIEKSPAQLDQYVARLHGPKGSGSRVLLAGINGARLFGEDITSVQLLFRKVNQIFPNTYWIPEDRLARTSSKLIDEAITWLEGRFQNT